MSTPNAIAVAHPYLYYSRNLKINYKNSNKKVMKKRSKPKSRKQRLFAHMVWLCDGGGNGHHARVV